jgi:hypothetical protein
MRNALQLLALPLVLALVLAAAGCGGGKKSAATTETATLATTTTTTTTSTPATTPVSSAVATAKNCKQLSTLGSQLAQQLTGADGNLAKEAALLKAFAAQTPADIRPDFETLADAFTKIATALKGVKLNGGVPNASTLAKIQKLGSETSGPKFTQALNHVEAWATKNCGVSG